MMEILTDTCTHLYSMRTKCQLKVERLKIFTCTHTHTPLTPFLPASPSLTFVAGVKADSHSSLVHHRGCDASTPVCHQLILQLKDAEKVESMVIDNIGSSSPV